jgi:hypothetical protein
MGAFALAWHIETRGTGILPVAWLCVRMHERLETAV